MGKPNFIRFLTSSYGVLTERKWMPSHLYTPLRGSLRRIAMRFLPGYFANNPADLSGTKSDDIIVSLTSFPARIEYVYIVIESLLRQTVLPHKIILWLSSEQFSGYEILPDSLLKLKNEIFEIRFVEGDIKSHKKYYYASKEYPDYLIVLADDDILYPPQMIEELHDAYLNNNGGLVCRYGCRVTRNQNGELIPYVEWPHIFNSESGNDIFFGSGGGTMFCPKDLCDSLTDIQSAIMLSPYSDDIWLNAVARLSHIKITMLKHGRFFPLNIPDKRPLVKVNVVEGQNDIQLRDVINRFNGVL